MFEHWKPWLIPVIHMWVHICTQKQTARELSRIVRKPDFAYAKTKAQISFAVTAKLTSAFVFATWIVQFLFFLKPKFQSSSLFLKLYVPVWVRPGRKPRRPVFSRRGSFIPKTYGAPSPQLCLTLHMPVRWTNRQAWTYSLWRRAGVWTVYSVLTN